MRWMVTRMSILPSGPEIVVESRMAVFVVVETIWIAIIKTPEWSTVVRWSTSSMIFHDDVMTPFISIM